MSRSSLIDAGRRHRQRLSSSFTLSLALAVSLSLSLLPWLQVKAQELPLGIVNGVVTDWLVPDPSVTYPVTLSEDCAPATCSPATRCLCLSNGLLTKTWSLAPAFGLLDYYSSSAQASLFRSLEPEAVIALDGIIYNVGDLIFYDPNTVAAYAQRSVWSLAMNQTAYHFVEYSIATPQQPYPFTPGNRHSDPHLTWPPQGLHLTLTFRAPSTAPQQHRELIVKVHHIMYANMPVTSKWVTIERSVPKSNFTVMVNSMTVESLALNNNYSPLQYDAYYYSPLTVESASPQRLQITADWPHGIDIEWGLDPRFSFSPGSAQPTLTVSYLTGPQAPISILNPTFESFKVLALVTDTMDKERYGLSVRAMLRTLAPQTTENPMFFHLTDASSKGIRTAADQLAEMGFEMIILSFGTSFNMESVDEAYLDQMKADIAYANDKGIEVGGYDLICWTRGNTAEYAAIDPATNQTTGDSCFASGWPDDLLKKILYFIERTGLSAVELDGPYPGYECASTTHAHHTNAEDSVFHQTRIQAQFLTALRTKGIYIHQPDNYWYAGGSKTLMGYNENQFSLPRWEDLSVSRQCFYETTFLLPVTAGWGFLPLQDYHSGGDAAAFYPYDQNFFEYEWAFAQYFGMGVAACYRGTVLYDTPRVKAMVRKWSDFFHAHREILNSDIIHVQRADMQTVDYFVHVNPLATERALAMMFNPSPNDVVQRTFSFPLYYAGFTTTLCAQRENSTTLMHLTLDRNYRAQITLDLAGMSYTWFTFTDCFNGTSSSVTESSTSTSSSEATSSISIASS